MRDIGDDADPDTTERYFSLLTGGVYGTLHRVSHEHLALSQAEGKRLTCRPMVKAQNVGTII